MIQHNSLLSCAPTSTADSPHATQAASTADSPRATEAAVSLQPVCPSPEATNAVDEQPASETADSQTLSQKDFATALAISQARVSQLVKIGMPLTSIAAAQEWRIKQQTTAKDTLQAVESAAAAAVPSVKENNEVVGPHASSLPQHAAQPQLAGGERSQPHQPFNSSAAYHSSSAAAAISTPKQYFSREKLESLTTLELRELCKPRGLKVCGFKNDLVFRLLFSYATDAQISGNYEPLRDFSTGDLQRICQERGLSTSGTSNDLILRLAEPVSGTLGDEVPESHAQSINQRHPPPSNSPPRASRTAAVAAVAALHTPTTSADSPLASSSLLGVPLTMAPAAASTHIASSSSSSSTSSSIRSTSRILPNAISRPSSISRASSSSLVSELPLKRALHAKPEQPVPPKTLPRAPVASLDLYFPVPSDPVFSVTAPILVDTYSVSGTDLTPFILIENAAPHPVHTFPLFVLPAPPRTFTQAAPNQRLPAGLGLSSCVATQHFPRNSTFITSFSSVYTSPGTTSVFLVSPQALANYVAFLFQKAAVHTT